MLKPILTLCLLVAALSSNAAQAMPQWEPADAKAAAALPTHLQAWADLPAGSVTPMQRSARKAGADWQIVLPDGSVQRVVGGQRIVHDNGDVSYSGTLEHLGAAYPVLMTVGRNASFGLWQTAGGRYSFEGWGAQGWLLDTGHPQLVEEGLQDDAELPPAATHRSSGRDDGPASGKASGDSIDLLMLYTAGFAARYPDGAAQTRINHLVAIANQVLANSDVGFALRLVGAEQVAYTDGNDNLVARDALAGAMDGRISAGLESVRALRDERGADLVSMIRPHDIETRGSCGIAYFPGQGDAFGVNLVSDGFHSWSLCSVETLAHEIGHNLGAEHQVGQSSANAEYAHAYIQLGRSHTVMGSFGTGSPDRYLRLQRFSNPQQRCGGRPCGAADADNARRLRSHFAEVSAYRAATSTAAVPQVSAQDPDEDGDGVAESEDAFPHDARWHADRDNDGVADDVDAFADDAAHWSDLDADGIPDSSDPDRDGDGVANAADSLPDDPRDSTDGDGDGVGNSLDAFPADPAEWADSDGDGQGDFADADADGDGTPDLATGDGADDVDLLVVSAGNDRVLRFDGDSGLFAAVELVGGDRPQSFGFQSQLAWSDARKALYVLESSAIQRYTRAPTVSGGRFIVAANAGGTGDPLPGAFPVGLLVEPSGDLLAADQNSGLSRFSEGSGRARPGGAYGTPSALPDGVRSIARGPNGALWLLLQDERLAEVDVATGAVRRVLSIGNLAGLPGAMRAITVAPDGAVLIADRVLNRILRLDPESPTGATIHIANGAGGLRRPTALAIGPDGRLYVSSSTTHQVLRFDVATGAFIDVFTRAASGALMEPHALAFVPRVEDRYPLDAARQWRPQLGGWWNPQRSGHGIELARSGSQLAVTWYTFNADGSPTWYLAVGPWDGGADWQAELLRFEWDGAAAQPTVVGSAGLRFSGERALQFDWQLGDASGSEPMQPLTVGLSSETQRPTAAWYPPAETGWGMSFARQGATAYALVFLYDVDGQPTWAFGAGEFDAANMSFPLSQGRSLTRCPGCSGAADPEFGAAGTLQFRLAPDGLGGEVDAAIQHDGVNWVRAGRAFAPLTNFPTDLQGRPQ